MATFAELKADAHNASLVRKVTQSVAFYAPMSAPVPTSLVGEDGQLQALPEAYTPLGLVVKDSGFEFNMETDTEEVEAHGFSSPVREDIVRTDRTIGATFLETSRVILEQYYGLDLSNVEPTATGEIAFNEVDGLDRPRGRLVLIGSDGVGEGQWFIGKIMPEAQVTGVESHSWNGSDALAYGLTYRAYVNNAAGYSIRHTIAGPGAAANAAAMGFGS